MTLASQQAIAAYLAALRKQLRDLRGDDANDIVEEIHAHILDKNAGEAPDDAVYASLAALGSPAELADRYRTPDLLHRAQLARSPGRKFLRGAGLGTVGLLVFALSTIGSYLGGALVILAALKIAYPQNTGVWKDAYKDGTRGSAVQFGSSPRVIPPGVQTTHELLGWWFVPIALTLGIGLLFLTFQFGLWTLRKFWHSRLLLKSHDHPDGIVAPAEMP